METKITENDNKIELHYIFNDEDQSHSLDAFTRITMQNEVLKIWEKEKRTMILVTHDIDEAIFLSDRIVILSERPGNIKEIINVDLPRPRDRSRQEFLNIRKKILTSFIGNSGLDVEYYI